MLWVIIGVFELIGFFMWTLIHGAAKCRSDEETAFLDEEQARIISEMRKSSR